MIFAPKDPPPAWHGVFIRVWDSRSVLKARTTCRVLGMVVLMGMFERRLATQVLNAPRLSSIMPAGAQAGSDCEVSINGESIEGDQQLLFSDPRISASSVAAPASRFYPTTRPVANRFVVKVGSQVLPGTYSVRVVTPLGISNSRRFLVGSIPEVTQKKSNHEPAEAAPASVNSVINGVLAPQTSDYYRFSATQGQKLVLHCSTRLMDSRAEPALAIYNSTGSVLKQIHDPIHIEPTLSFTVPSDGDYYLSVHDFVYAGGPEYGYRLSISTGPWIDFVDPPFASSDHPRHTLYGWNLPGSTTSGELTRNGEPLEKLEVSIDPPAAAAPALETFLQPADAGVDSFPYRFTGTNGISNAVRMVVAKGALTNEAEPNNTPEEAQAISLPAQVVGRFNPRNDRDWYSFHATKGEKLWIEVISQRLGLPTDPRLTIQQVVTDKAGKTTVKELADVDDAPKLEDGGKFRVTSEDPAVAFTAPDDGDYRILVQDLYSSGQGAPWLYYLLSVRPASPDFQLLTYPARLSANDNGNTPQSTVARKGSGTVIDVVALRRDGFAEAIALSAEGCPPGVTVRPGYIAQGASVGAMMLQVAPDAGDWAGAIRIVGKAAPAVSDEDTTGGIAGTPASEAHVATPVETLFNSPNGGTIQPMRLETTYGLAIRDGLTLPFTIDAGEEKVWRVPRGGKLQIPVQIIRNAKFVDEKFAGEIKLQAVTQGQVRAEALSFDAGTNQKDLVVSTEAGAATGRYSLILKAEAPATIARPDGGKAAAEDLKRIDALAKQITEAAQKAAQSRDRAEQVLTQATASLAQAREQKAAKKQAADAAALKARESAHRSEAILQAGTAQASGPSPSAAPANDASSAKEKASLAETQRQASDDAAKAAAAQTAAEAAVQAESDAQQKLKLAEEGKSKASKDETAAKDDVKAAEEARRVAEEQARKAAEQSKPRNLRVQIASAPIQVEVLAAPFALHATPPSQAIDAGAKPVEIPVSITPEFGFSDEVKFELVAPSGASGVSLVEKQNAIAAGQTAATLVLHSDRAAAAGAFTFSLRAHYRFNGRDLTLERPFPLQIIASSTPPKK